MDDKYQVMPPLTDGEYQQLKNDIAENGVLVPIEFDTDGNCLDGHHRLQICEELGIKDYPKVIRVGMDFDKADEIAVTLNLARRQLSHNQKIEVAKILKARHPEWPVSKIASLVGVNNLDLSGQLTQSSQLATVEGSDGKQYPATNEQAQQQREEIRETISEHPDWSDRKVADEVGASHSTVAKQREVVNKIRAVFNPSGRDEQALNDPDIQERIIADESLNVAGAIREQKRDQLVQHLESVETQEAKAVEGVYDVIVIDPPWPIQKMETDRRPLEVHMDYPVMDVEEIKAMDIPAADDCHIFLWTTQKYLPTAFDVLRAWGFKYVCTFVWHKVGGYKPLDLPRYDCEFCLYAHKGVPRFIDDHQFWTCFDGTYFDAPTNGHSVKPDEFYDMIRRVTAGRRLDMFNRRKIDGFDGWGKEAE